MHYYHPLQRRKSLPGAGVSILRRSIGRCGERPAVKRWPDGEERGVFCKFSIDAYFRWPESYGDVDKLRHTPMEENEANFENAFIVHRSLNVSCS